MPPEVLDHYERFRPEQTRIREGFGQLELVRTQEIVRRFLPPAPARVLDVGGADGVHATWLADDGYDVEIVDVVPAHVEEARRNGSERPRPFGARLGDARELPGGDETFDVVLVLGPLYHLTERTDRVRALVEARRVVRPGGVVFGAAISRFASLFDGLARERLFDPAFRRIVEQDLVDGQHRNPTDEPGWFTTAFFHHPDELRHEAQDAQLAVEAVLGVEGLAGWMRELAPHWDDTEHRELIVQSARATEAEPALAGLSSHLLLVAHRR
jgi:2-polyprenyl-3-methyl-5-hydroxy-6-metoxy-1,4-benzoquinol methylase